MDPYKSMNKNRQNEFSRSVELKESNLEKKIKVSATKEELEELAIRLDVQRIDNLQVTYIITDMPSILGAYMLVATLESKVVKFVIEETEEAIEISDNFDVVLVTEDMARNNYEELREHDIEIINEERKVDIGEIATQYLSLCIYM